MEQRAQQEAPARVLDALGQVHKQALQGGALSRKVKALVALAVAVHSGCEVSVAYHLHNALEAGATREEVTEAVEVAVLVQSEPAAIHVGRILKALDLDAAGRFAAGMHGHGVHPYMTPD